MIHPLNLPLTGISILKSGTDEVRYYSEMRFRLDSLDSGSNAGLIVRLITSTPSEKIPGRGSGGNVISVAPEMLIIGKSSYSTLETIYVQCEYLTPIGKSE